jgi:hypothetical protein
MLRQTGRRWVIPRLTARNVINMAVLIARKFYLQCCDKNTWKVSNCCFERLCFETSFQYYRIINIFLWNSYSKYLPNRTSSYLKQSYVCESLCNTNWCVSDGACACGLKLFRLFKHKENPFDTITPIKWWCAYELADNTVRSWWKLR